MAVAPPDWQNQKQSSFSWVGSTEVLLFFFFPLLLALDSVCKR